jgi:hypothetical protein
MFTVTIHSAHLRTTDPGKTKKICIILDSCNAIIIFLCQKMIFKLRSKCYSNIIVFNFCIVLLAKTFKLFGFLIFWFWAYIMKLFQKRVVRIKFDIYGFISIIVIIYCRIFGNLYLMYNTCSKHLRFQRQ